MRCSGYGVVCRSSLCPPFPHFFFFPLFAATVLDSVTTHVLEEKAQTKMQLLLSGLSVVKVDADQRFALLRPMELRFESLRGADTGMHGTLRLSEVLAMISMRDVKMLMRATKPWVEVDELLAEPATMLVRALLRSPFLPS